MDERNGQTGRTTKATSRRGRNTGSESTGGQMAADMRGRGVSTRLKGTGGTSGRTGGHTKGAGKGINYMGKGLTDGLTGESTRASITKTRNMDMESIPGLTAVFSMATGRMGNSMVKAPSEIQRAWSEMECGQRVPRSSGSTVRRETRVPRPVSHI